MKFSRHTLERGSLSSVPLVRPDVILAATMFVGVWMAWPWSVVNGLALGVDRRRLALQVIFGLAGASALALLFTALIPAEPPDDGDFSWLPYVLIALRGWKLVIAYAMFNEQNNAMAVFSYYGGEPKNGIPLVVGGSLLRGWVLLDLLPIGWWTLVLA